MTRRRTGYDYVIVGGGSAGCVLANRLSADPAVSVAMLEAGPADRSPLIRMPLGIIALMRSKRLNWAYYTEPQAHLAGRRLFWPRGRTLGGSSAINAMCYTRGAPADYDHWAALGNTGWGYAELLPCFRKSEGFEGGASREHGDAGGYAVSRGRHDSPLNEGFIAAAEACGFPRSDDFACYEGVGRYHVAQRNGRRCSNADAFLHPVRSRPNLTVITRARATRIHFEGRRAVGVSYRRGRARREQLLEARAEVLVCAGAINSPQLLLLSGIGPRHALEPYGISVQHELPGVGGNLQDHLDISLVERESSRHSLRLDAGFLLRGAPVALWQYLRHGRGWLTSNVAESGGFIRSGEEREYADLQLHFIPTIEQDHGHRLANAIRYHGYTLRICDLRPRSRGTVRLHSADPMAAPEIDPNYLDDPRDLEQLVKAVEIGRRILRSPPLAAHRRDELEPGDGVRSRAEIEDFIRRRAETIYHPVGTCKMGHDDQAVVDPRLRVHGIEGLRVVDASIMPTLVGGNANAPTTAIAEKAADLIAADNS